MFLLRGNTGAVYCKKTAIKTAKLDDTDEVLMKVKWLIQSIISSLCGVQRRPVNTGTWKNMHKDGEQELITVTGLKTSLRCQWKETFL